MTATVHALPGFADAGPPASLNLTPAEVQEAAGGYVRPSDQLRVLHDRGFTRAYISTVGAKRVVLERAHYDAVVRGQFGHHDQAAPQCQRTAPRTNRAALQRLFQQQQTQGRR